MPGIRESSVGISGGGFALTCESSEDSARVAMAGELDLATAPQVASALGSLEKNGVCSIVLDLSALTFIDVSGLRERSWPRAGALSRAERRSGSRAPGASSSACSP